MSYILDALKKSEQQRNDGSADNVRPIHGLHMPSVARQYKPPRRWPWLVVSAVVISMGIGGGAWFYYQATLQTVAQPAEPPPAEAKIPQPEIVPADVATAPPEPIAKPTPPAQTDAQDPLANLATESASESEIAVETARPIVMIADLPAEIRQRLPAISFAGHVYSSTVEARSVVINGHKLREGQNVSKELIVDEITRFGAVFRFAGYRFSLSALQDWRNE